MTKSKEQLQNTSIFWKSSKFEQRILISLQIPLQEQDEVIRIQNPIQKTTKVSFQISFFLLLIKSKEQNNLICFLFLWKSSTIEQSFRIPLQTGDEVIRIQNPDQSTTKVSFNSSFR
jgi:hypothetical protein